MMIVLLIFALLLLVYPIAWLIGNMDSNKDIPKFYDFGVADGRQYGRPLLDDQVFGQDWLIILWQIRVKRAYMRGVKDGILLQTK